MKAHRAVWALVLAGGLLIPAGGQAADPAVKKVMEQVLAAYGGRDALRAVEVAYYEGTIVFFNGDTELFSAPLRSWAKNGRHIRYEMDVNGQTTIRGYDGKEGWVKDPQLGVITTDPATSKILQRAGESGSKQMSHYDDPGWTTEYLGTAMVRGQAADYVQMKTPLGNVLRLCFDQKTHLILKSEMDLPDAGTPGRTIHSEQFFHDYRWVGGRRTWFRVEVYLDGRKDHEFRVNKMVWNTGEPDSFFDRPSSGGESK